MYYTSIPLVSERTHARRWDAAKLRDLRKRLDSGTMTLEDIDQTANEFLDSEIVDLASDWLGNTVSSLHRAFDDLTLIYARASVGRSEIIREVLPRTSIRNAREALPSPCYDRYSQERNVGCAENH